jgi:hypothetical protein
MPFGRDSFLPKELETLLAMFDDLTEDVTRYEQLMTQRSGVIENWLALSGNN